MPDEPEEDILLSYIDVYHAAAILQAISAYSMIEYEIDCLIWDLARVEPEVGACLTAQYIGSASRMDALIALAHEQKVGAESIKNLNKFKDKVGALGRERNRLAHDPWFFAHNTKQLYRLETSAKGPLKHMYQPVTEEELKALEKKFNDGMAQFREIKAEILRVFYSWS